MHIWIYSTVKWVTNTKVPTEDVFGLPVYSCVRGAHALPPRGMTFDCEGFVFHSRDWLELAFQGITFFGL